MGLFNMIEENLAFPFQASILGATVMAESVEQREDRIVAICKRCDATPGSFVIASQAHDPKDPTRDGPWRDGEQVGGKPGDPVRNHSPRSRVP